MLRPIAGLYRGAGVGVGVRPGGRRIGAPPPAEWSRGCGAVAALHVTVRRARSSRRGHRLSVASPSYCLPDGRDGGARCTAPLHSACPPGAMPPSHGPPPPVALHPPRPEEFSASGGKNRLCSEPRIISARRTAPLRPLRRPPLPPPPPRRSSAAPFTLPTTSCLLLDTWLFYYLLSASTIG
ncbi:unnamed protein product [Chrysodeixis includens]|uniref:Uncharacterized protein n=1 Tax=Chrysodeixis includens TaxID=689277 RepID=A0A9N8KR76_CHRIL|nr:unnamed protein product [Chrysodeixis includens]